MTDTKLDFKQLDETDVLKTERQKVKRRRQIDPTTCEREYSGPEIEFMHAMDEYKRSSGRMFPTNSEILEVLLKMGYRKIANAQEIYTPQQPLESQDHEDISLREKQIA
jgi:hypothetical protein